jgi:hypothetical protein
VDAENKEHHHLYSSPNIISDQMEVEMISGACCTHGEMRSAYKILVGKPEERKTLFVRPRRRWEDNIKMDLK